MSFETRLNVIRALLGGSTPLGPNLRRNYLCWHLRLRLLHHSLLCWRLRPRAGPCPACLDGLLLLFYFAARLSRDNFLWQLRRCSLGGLVHTFVAWLLLDLMLYQIPEFGQRLIVIMMNYLWKAKRRKVEGNEIVLVCLRIDL